jgi:hypothetical protein
MTEEQMQLLYAEVIRSGLFWELFPNLTGVWNTDKGEWVAFVVSKVKV